MFRSRSAGNDKLGRISALPCASVPSFIKRDSLIILLLIYFIMAEDLLDFARRQNIIIQVL